MTNDRRLALAYRAGLAAALAAAGLIVAAPVSVAQVQLGAPIAADTIGDPSWDEAEVKPPAAE